MPLGRAIFRIMLDLNPSVYVIIDPCCPQMLEKMGPPDITGFGFQIKPASSLRSPPHQARKPNLSGPPEATTILTQGGYGKRYQPRVLLEAMVHLEYGIEISPM